MSQRIVVICLLLCLKVNAWADGEVLSGFPAPQEDFQAHVREVRRYLLDTQMPQRLPADVDYNIPFEIPANPNVAYRGKYLLIHGLNETLRRL